MAILTDKQMIWVVGGGVLLLYLAGKAAEEKLKAALAALAALPSAVVGAASDAIDIAVAAVGEKRSELDNRYQQIFLNNVIATTGVVPADFMEEQVALQYMPAKTTQELQVLFYPKNNVPSLLSAAQIGFTAVQAWRAGSAVKDYRQNKGKAPVKHWYDIF